MTTFQELKPGSRFVVVNSSQGPINYEFVKLAISRATDSSGFGPCSNCKTKSTSYIWNTVNESGRLVHVCDYDEVYQVE